MITEFIKYYDALPYSYPITLGGIGLYILYSLWRFVRARREIKALDNALYAMNQTIDAATTRLKDIAVLIDDSEKSEKS